MLDLASLPISAPIPAPMAMPKTGMKNSSPNRNPQNIPQVAPPLTASWIRLRRSAIGVDTLRGVMRAGMAQSRRRSTARSMASARDVAPSFW